MKKIPLVKPEFNAQKLYEDFKKIARSGILTKGLYLQRFEQNLAKFLKVKYVFATTSCTTALHLCLAALEVGPGDEVIVSDFTFPATGNVVVECGAKPVLVDCARDSFNIDPGQIESVVTKSAKGRTKAIIVVHAFGQPSSMKEILKIANKHNLPIIEDAACALGSYYQNKPCGAIGTLGCFSFHPRKNITTGEGGAVVTNDPKLAQSIEILRNHGGQKNTMGEIEFVKNGFNYRLSELQAALGLEQLSKINKVTSKRKKLGLVYHKAFRDIGEIEIYTENKEGESNFQSLVIILPQRVNRYQLQKYLAQNGIETTIGTYALHAQKSFARFGYKPGDLPNSYKNFKQALTLPLFDRMTNKEINYIVKKIAKFMQNEK